MFNTVEQFEQKFVFEELEKIGRDIGEVVHIYRDVPTTDHMDIPRLVQLQLKQLQMFRTLTNIESLLLKD
jgi:hypothetical protein